MTQVVGKRLELRGAALAVMKCRAPEALLAGPAGTGKSYACLWKLHQMMLLTPGARALIVRKTHVSLTETGLVTFREQVLPEALATGLVSWYGGSGDKPAGYRYSNGSFVAVGGLDKPAKIMSSEYDLVYVQEATDLSLNDVEMITTRLRNGKVSFQQLLMDCNPQHPTHWLKKRCDDGKTVMLYSRHEDNPRVFDDAGRLTEYGATYIKRLDQLSGVRRERLRHGRWAAAEGVIYDEWRPEIHLVNRLGLHTLPKEWERIWAVDFGYANPFVWQMWAVDPDGRMWLEKEIYHTQRLVEDHAKMILSVVMTKPRNDRPQTWKYPRPRAIVCDHDAEDRATLERHLGMGTIAARKSVSDGIEAMQARLRVAGDGKPRLLVCRDALVERDIDLKERGLPTCFAEEIEGYIRKPPSATARPGQVPDEPLKENDHSMDAARYAVAHLDLAPTPRVRWM